MIQSTAHKLLSDRINYYQQRECPGERDNKTPKLTPAGLQWRNRVTVASIATSMNVPVVLASFRDENDVRTFVTHGLDLMHNLARFAAACDNLCDERLVVIPDTRSHPVLGTLARHWPTHNICFLVGIPLRDGARRRVGSLAVMNSSRAVAQSGISFRALSALGTVFTETGQLKHEALAV